MQPSYLSKIYFRKLSNSDATTIPRKWLSFNKENEKVYCFICMASSVNKDLPFVQGMQVQIKHILKQIQTHGNSQLHNEAVQSYIKVKANKDISSLININLKNARL